MVRLRCALLGCVAGVVMMVTPGHFVGAAQAASVQSGPPTLSSTWTLGSRLSLAAVLYDANAPAETVDKWFTNARTLGLLMGVTVPPLPTRTEDKVKDSATVLAYILNVVGQPTIKMLGEKYTEGHARVFELAIKSNLLLMLYVPGDSLTQTIAEVIERNATFARLPAALWKPVIDLVRKGGTFNDVKEAVFQMHSDIKTHLANAQ